MCAAPTKSLLIYPTQQVHLETRACIPSKILPEYIFPYDILPEPVKVRSLVDSFPKDGILSSIRCKILCEFCLKTASTFWNRQVSDKGTKIEKKMDALLVDVNKWLFKFTTPFRFICKILVP